jgi:optic atrophy protein 1
VFPAGVTFQTYEHWKESLPDMKWLDDYFPDSEQWNSFRGVLVGMKDKMDNIELGTVSIQYSLLTYLFGNCSEG